MCLLDVAESATYRLEQLSSPGERVIAGRSDVDAIPGLHVGSMLAFKDNCVNVDISGVSDNFGASTTPGVLFALKAQEAELGPTEPRNLYFLQQDGTQPFPFAAGRFDWVREGLPPASVQPSLFFFFVTLTTTAIIAPHCLNPPLAAAPPWLRTGASQVMAEHFIEHISFADAVKFLAEVRRLLKPGGTLRLSTPDLAIYAAAFFDPAQRFYQEHYKVWGAKRRRRNS